jgi:site-specific recombinase XerD
MKLAEVVGEYVTHKQSMGMRFCTEARTLKSFCRAMGDIAMTEVQRDRVEAYLAGKGPVTRFWQRKHEVLVGFYRFAIARGYALHVPLPHRVPKPAQAFVPHIYSHDELRRLLKATSACDNPRSNIESDTCRTLILLLYGAGLRISEALALTLADVDLSTGILIIHTSKFYKTRLVPLGPDLTRALRTYATRRAMQYPSGPEGAFFVSRIGNPLTRRAAEDTFSQLRLRAGVLRHDGARYQPRLHDLRHAFAVHRLVAWYRQGADVQRLLPQLATYLGHVHLAATQRYLTMTPELLQEASQRFERYAGEVACE